MNIVVDKTTNFHLMYYPLDQQYISQQIIIILINKKNFLSYENNKLLEHQQRK